MTTAPTWLTVRRLMVDLQTPLPRHWCGGDPFLTALFNALSMSFPVGEQFFIDAVRAGVRHLPPPEQQAFEVELQGFVGQEATHRHLHAQFNRHLHHQGLHNVWEGRIRRRLSRLDGLDPRHAVAITAANEHFTAVLAEWLLSRPQILGGTEPRLAALWLWHSAEELEHKATAFNLYRALGGNLRWRRRWMRRVTVFFLGDLLRQTCRNLWDDGQWWRWRTWRSAARHLFGADGLIRHNLPAWRRYFRADFHPDQQDTGLSHAWLHAHQDLWRATADSRLGPSGMRHTAHAGT